MSTTSAAFAFNSASNPDAASPSAFGASEDSPAGLLASDGLSEADSEYQRLAGAMGLLSAVEAAGRAECVNVRDEIDEVAVRMAFMTVIEHSEMGLQKS